MFAQSLFALTITVFGLVTLGESEGGDDGVVVVVHYSMVPWCFVDTLILGIVLLDRRAEFFSFFLNVSQLCCSILFLSVIL